MSEGELSEIDKAIFLDEDNPLRKIDSEKQEIPIESDLDYYIYGCSQSLSAVSAALEKTKMSILLLEQARDLIPENSPFNEYEFIEYSIENYFIRSVGLYDRCLIFTNRLLDLGIANESIDHVLVVTNEHVIHHELAEPLKKIGKACREFSKDRNVIIHHGRYNDESFKTVSAIHKVNELTVKNGKDPLFRKQTVDILTDRAIQEKLVDFNKHLEKIESRLNDFFVAALPVYQEMKITLKKL